MAINLDTVRQDLRRLEQAPAVAADLARRLQDAIESAARHTDAHLTQDGLAAKHGELAEEYREAARGDLEKARGRATSTVNSLQRLAEEVRPRVGDDAGSLLRSQQKWDQVRMQLDNRLPLYRAVQDADLTTLLAIEEFAPAWLAAQSDQHPVLGDGNYHTVRDRGAVVQGMIAPRLIALSPADVAEVLTAARDGALHVAVAEHWWTFIQDKIEGRSADFFWTAIAARGAAQQAPSGNGGANINVQNNIDAERQAQLVRQQLALEQSAA